MTAMASFHKAIVHNLVDIADFLLQHLEGAANISIAIVDREDGLRPIVELAATDLLPAVHLSHGGPAFAASLTGRIARSPHTGERHAAWDDYNQTCYRQGILSVAAFPILDHEEVVGVLTVGSTLYRGFGRAETRIGQAAAAQVTPLVLAARLG